MSTVSQEWISRVNGGLDNYNMTDSTTEEDLKELVVDLMAGIPYELIDEVAREISRYAIAKQNEYNKRRREELAVATPPLPDSGDDGDVEERSDEAKEERSDDERTEEVSDGVEEHSDGVEERSDGVEEHSDDDEVGEIQNAYNEINWLLKTGRPESELLEILYAQPKIANEVDKWGWMLLHHAIAKFATPPFIEAVIDENPNALMIEVGEDQYNPLQIAVRCGRSLEVIKTLYKANPAAVGEFGTPHCAHSIACSYGRSTDIRVFLYTYRDGAPIVEEETEEVIEKNEDVWEGIRHSYPIMVVMVAWIAMLVVSIGAGVRTIV
jgi:hypothetical protein